MKKAKLFFLLIVLVLISKPLMAAAPNTLVLENQTISDGQVLEYYAYENLTAGPSYVMESGSEVTLRSSGSVTLAPGFSAQSGSKLVVEIVAEPPNFAPVAAAVAVTTDEDTPVVLPLSATDEDLDPLTYHIVTDPAHGTLSGTYPDMVYTPALNFNGTDTLTYKANDGRSDSNTETVTITIDPINDAPESFADTFAVNEDNPLTLSPPGILANDSDTEGSSLGAVLVDSPLNGTLTLNNDGSFDFDPDLNFNGTDTFTYKVTDGELESNISTVSIIVNPINDGPVAVNQIIGLAEDTPTAITLAGNDIEGDPLAFAVTAQPGHGTLSGTAPDLTYTPDQNYSGPDSFTFSADDGNVSSGGTVSINISPVNDAPDAGSDSFSMHVNTVLNISAPGVLGNDLDMENDTLTASLLTGPANGTLALNTDGSFTYTPGIDFSGTDSFSYKANDGTADSFSATATINVTVVPVAHQQSVTTSEDTDQPITLTGADQFNNPITYTILTHPTNGLLSGASPSLTYSPDTDYTGTDSFTFKVNNGMEDSAPAVVYITITPVNDQPIAVDDNIETDEDTTLTSHNLLLNDTDVENNALTIASFTQPANGSITNNGDGSFTYAPAENFNGPDLFIYIVNDGEINSEPATVNILVNAVNDLPIAGAQSLSTPANTPLDILVTGSDIEGDPFSFELVDSPAQGALSGTLPNLTYTPNQNVYGDDSFSFRLKEGELYSEKAIVAIHVKTPKPEAFLSGSTALVSTGGSVTLTWSTLFANQGVTITPDKGSVAESGNTTLYPADTTTYTLTATGEGGVTTKTFLVEVDHQAPVVVGYDPPDNGQVNLETLDTGIRVTYSDNIGIASVQLYRLEGDTPTDVTGLAIVNGNVVNLDISALPDGYYQYKVIITDTAGNETIQLLNFTIDKTLPETFASVESGTFAAPFTLDLTCSETATIFYSTDGSPPFEGGTNTLSASAPVTGLEIDHSMNLQFFAKDEFGNRELVQSMVYLFDGRPDALSGITAIYTDPNVDITWDPSADADTYRIYRALSPVDRHILEQSIQGGYAPPEKLIYSDADIPSGTTSYQDTDVLPGMTYYYGVIQINSNGQQGPMDELASVSVPEAGTALDAEEAKARAFAWLESVQDVTGFWSDKKETRMLATSQVLSAYQRSGQYDLNITYGLFYLRGQLADNNDYLARKILTLHGFGQNVDVFVNKLISQAYFDTTALNGWGLNVYYAHDALDTALGILAVDCHSSITFNTFAAHQLQTNTDLQSAETGQFGWIPKGTSSVYVSSLVYQVIDTSFPDLSPVFDPSWITGSQAADGSFGSGVIDTSAVILQMDTLPPTQKQAAVSYLISRQQANGSWESDPYITGLCLEALLK